MRSAGVQAGSHAERYRIMLVLDTTTWAVRESDGEEVMFLIENLIRP
jgi:hypothetical protein